MVVALLRWSYRHGMQTQLHRPIGLSLRRLHTCVLRGRLHHIFKERKIIQQIYGQLKDGNFVFIEEGDVTEYLGIKMNHHKDGSMQLSQPRLLKRIIDSIPGMEGVNPKEIPAMPSVALTKHHQGKLRKGNWNYRSVIVMLNFQRNLRTQK